MAGLTPCAEFHQALAHPGDAACYDVAVEWETEGARESV